MTARVLRSALATFLLAGTFSVAPAFSPCAGVAAAQGLHHAGLVIQFEDQAPRQFCVSFAEESITGLDLLERTKLLLNVQDYGGGNVAVCAIDGQGCPYPRVPCFCKCANLKDCTIWGFYRLSASGTWQFSQEGAAIVNVKDGDLHGWRWAKTSTSGGSPPDSTTLAKVCASGIRIGATAATAAPAGKKKASSPWPAAIAFAVLLAVLLSWSAARRRSREAGQ